MATFVLHPKMPTLFLGRVVAQAPISGFFRPSVLCMSITFSFWRGFDSNHWFYPSQEHIWYRQMIV